MLVGNRAGRFFPCKESFKHAHFISYRWFRLSNRLFSHMRAQKPQKFCSKVVSVAFRHRVEEENVKQSTKFKVTSSRLIRFGTRLKVKLVSSSRFISTRILFYAPNQQTAFWPQRGQYFFTFFSLKAFLLHVSYSILNLPHGTRRKPSRCIIAQQQEEIRKKESSKFIIASLLATLNFIMNDNVMSRSQASTRGQTHHRETRGNVSMP